MGIVDEWQQAWQRVADECQRGLDESPHLAARKRIEQSLSAGDDWSRRRKSWAKEVGALAKPSKALLKSTKKIFKALNANEPGAREQLEKAGRALTELQRRLEKRKKERQELETAVQRLRETSSLRVKESERAAKLAKSLAKLGQKIDKVIAGVEGNQKPTQMTLDYARRQNK